jgi:hypothetical protein
VPTKNPKNKTMKKLTLLAVVALAFSFASCKKDRTCTCTTTTTFAAGGSYTGKASVTTHKKIKKSAGQAICHDTESTDSNGDKDVTTCTLS